LKSNKDDDTDDEYEKPIPILKGPIDEARESKTRAQEESRQYRKLQSKFDRLLVAFTGVTALVGIVQGYLTWQAVDVAARQASSAERSNVLVRQAMKYAYVQSKDAARASAEDSVLSRNQSKAALDASIKSSRTDQRAWLAAADETYNIAASGPMKGSVVVFNIGKTPALSVTCKITGITTHRDHILRDSDLAYPAELPILKVGTLFPNHQFPMSAGGTAMDPDKQKIWFANIQSGELVQYFFGEIRYKDAFGREHYSHFCTRFLPSTNSGTPCPIYNGTDDINQ